MEIDVRAKAVQHRYAGSPPVDPTSAVEALAADRALIGGDAVEIAHL
jgi:hypothetical protein